MVGFTQIRNDILLGDSVYGNLSPSERLFLMVLINRQIYFTDKDGNPLWFFCRMAWLSNVLGVKRNQIYEYKKKLEECGLIETKIERDEKKRKTTYFRVDNKCLITHT